ncbi:hypothetical protein BDP27DRAFT_1420762 [Rhodocollybia butyracea]|uniref:No apical meristem-associated C-terminal domain-containing protein n=1 Tax=Rhodocollybia butyracea TaxID=206335 RepID=A0A9P5PUN9_9AGAR|nr:hypothetical protein BDP27DRAFT_1420762 [Rhodocollybia butyracea]
MEKEVMKYKAEMGETGAGIQREDDIDMSLDNLLTGAWSRIHDICPWFFNMKALMAERPNLTPVGLGDSSTAINTEDILHGEEGDTDGSRRGDFDNNNEEDEGSMQKIATSDVDMSEAGDNDNEPIEVMQPGRKKRKESIPTNSSCAPAKKFKVSDEFSESTRAMEATCQKTLDLAKVRTENKGKKLQYKMAKLQAKEEERKRKYELDKAKAQKREELMNRMMGQSDASGSGQGWSDTSMHGWDVDVLNGFNSQLSYDKN